MLYKLLLVCATHLSRTPIGMTRETEDMLLLWLSISGGGTRTFRSAVRPPATSPTAPAGAASGPGTQPGYWAELCSKLVARVDRSSSYRALVRA